MVSFVWLPAMEAGWKAMAINPDQVSYLMAGPDHGEDGDATTLVVFGQMVGALAHLRVKGALGDVAAMLEGDKPAAPKGAPKPAEPRLQSSSSRGQAGAA